MPPFRASNARCELSCDMRSYVTSNENVPRHFFALARFFVGMVRRRGVVSKRTQAAPRFGGRGGIPPAPGVSLISECTNPHVMDYCGRLSVRQDRPSPHSHLPCPLTRGMRLCRARRRRRHAARPVRMPGRPPGSASQERRASCARHTETCLASIESGVFVEDRHVWFLRCARIHEGAPGVVPRGVRPGARAVRCGRPRTVGPATDGRRFRA